MKTIQLTQGQVAKVSDHQYDELNKYKWCANYDKKMKSYYAVRMTSRTTGKRKMISMHRHVTNAPDGMVVDHIDHDTLNNQAENLRVCTHKQNIQNQKIQASNTSGYKGVSVFKDKWVAHICAATKQIHIGLYTSPLDAAKAYDKAATELHGKFAKLNFPQQT